MTKNIIFIFAAFCTLQVRANVQPTEKDTVRCTFRYDDTELLQPLQPSYLDGVLVPARGNGNWFVSIAGGTTAFLGIPLGCEDLFGRLKPSYSLALGKWFTPWVGARINYNGLQFKDGSLSLQEYHHLHADLLWNVLGGSYARQEQVRWYLAPFAGIGLLHHVTNGHNPLAISYGIQGQYRISKRVSALVELSGTTTFQDFDGYGKVNRLGDHMLSLSVGFSFHIGRSGWKRAIDPSPYVRRDRWLVDYVNVLSEQNSRYAEQHDKDRRTLIELKKILEIEGLLDTYCHLFDDNDAIGRSGYPKNNYSGLNSLRARLKNRHWGGKSVLDGQSSNMNTQVLAAQDTLKNVRNSGADSERNKTENDNPSLFGSSSSEYTVLMQSGNECIGSPVYFFFELGTARLTDVSQFINIDELARVAKKYGLAVRVSGAADNMTGTIPINKALSISRADYIAAELVKRGLPVENITKSGVGGISDYTPDKANRHTKVMLYFK
ncbi:OmpA family protein [Bacteroides fragilis]|nr:OmpA family protein [Bacteroides fragilis]MCE9283780.1 OmpA family protein [Bacteroides fragilis]